jgi:hypothetical protein
MATKHTYAYTMHTGINRATHREKEATAVKFRKVG